MQIELGVTWQLGNLGLPQTCFYIGAPVSVALQISAMISEEFLGLIRCPLTLAGLTLAEPSLVAKINDRVAAGTLVNRGGETVDREIDGGLVSGGEPLLYAIRNDIPCLLLEEAIPLNQLDD